MDRPLMTIDPWPSGIGMNSCGMLSRLQDETNYSSEGQFKFSRSGTVFEVLILRGTSRTTACSRQFSAPELKCIQERET